MKIDTYEKILYNTVIAIVCRLLGADGLIKS